MYSEIAQTMKAEEIVTKIFKKYDQDQNQVLSKPEWPMVVKEVFDLFGAPIPTQQDIDDLFNYLDVNGDQRISHSELTVLIQKFLNTVKSN